ncbi:MAG TPA: PQQ-dependent sugar dehydrogenase [Vicinamibacterales bacterium]|nr:PQQ-dependent sugar dehydrogenase [Vicinamibacterales bacterium]
MRVSLLQRLALFAIIPVILVAGAEPVAAQATLRTSVVASGLTRPVGFVQDPSDATIQYILQHTGQILRMKNGVVQPWPFLDLSTAIINSGERGLLGLAFPSDYGTTGRFYVSFSAADTGEGPGHTVLARFRRSAPDPSVADPGSRFDLRWSTGERFIRQPFELHKAGHLAFGPDGYLYMSTGDGGADANDAGDPTNKAQDLSSLLGKMLRIDVNVEDSNPAGFSVPAGNPFVNTFGAAPEIWSLGFRNPWQFSFDAGTGAMVIGDVGHNLFEEVDYEPAGRGGRNYGWRLREGLHDYDVSLPPAFFPLQDPVFEYDHGLGRSITGGFIYRGHALGPGFVGRYIFADFMARRLFSLALTVDPATGEATASDLRDHTDELGGTAVIGGVSAFGVDAAGELYLVSLTRGEIRRLTATATALNVDGVIPSPGLLAISGWAIDTRAASGNGVDAIHAYAFPFAAGGTPVFVGATTSFQARPDVAALYGSQFAQSGFHILSTQWLHPGPTLIVMYGRSTVSGTFELVATAYFESLDTGQFVHSLDQSPAGTVSQPILFSGWAIDYLATTAPAEHGTGIAAVYIDIFSSAGVLVRTIPAAYGLPRPDVAAVLGARFQLSGFSATVHDLWPDEFSYRVRYVRSTGGEWSDAGAATFRVNAGPMVAIGTPTPGATVSPTFAIGGWAIDLRSAADSGVDMVHVWAYPNPGSGTPPVFLGAADYGAYRPDVGAAFGAQFTYSGFNLSAGPLAPGAYDVVVFARTVATGGFEIYGVVRVTVH